MGQRDASEQHKESFDSGIKHGVAANKREHERQQVEELLAPELLARLADAHCHPIDSWDGKSDELKDVALGSLCVMSTHLRNQHVTARYFAQFANKVVPFYGMHPWFVHGLSLEGEAPPKDEHYRRMFLPREQSEDTETSRDLDVLLPSLPTPTPLRVLIAELRERMQATPQAMLGEVGLDKSFRLHYPEGSVERETRKKSSSLATPPAHQLAVVRAQIKMALELRRNISFHSVRVQGDTRQLLDELKRDDLERWRRVYVCLHSFGGSAEVASQIQKEHPNVFFSFSAVISFRSSKFQSLLAAIRDDRLLVESDTHAASLLDGGVSAIVRVIAEERGWSVEDTVARLEANWHAFKHGPGEQGVQYRTSAAERKKLAKAERQRAIELGEEE